MGTFVIVEVEDGLTVVELLSGETPEDAAIRHGGFLVDAGPYHSYEEAYEAVMTYPDQEDPEQEAE